ncbi:hypothetical protein CFP56_014891 [Quercus suber]|uniref:Uncharacterized protein n=1 Tax=Quercus suber TaxID=58331 RepID=A0AAW0KRJ0_QUESU
MQDEEARSEIGRIATNFAKTAAVLACKEGLKTIPVETKALQAKISEMEEEIIEYKKLIEQAKIHKPFADFKLEEISSFESNVDEKPEDEIEDFMNFWMI